MGLDGQEGRIFYTPDLGQLNFSSVRTTLAEFLSRLENQNSDANAAALYLGSAILEQVLPEVAIANSLLMDDARKTVRIWIGNRTTVAAHYDTLDN